MLGTLRVPIPAAALVALIVSAVPTSASASDPILSKSPTSRAAAISGAVPDAGWSFIVPQAGTVSTPTEGTGATRLFRTCPNADGISTFPNHARIKIVLKDFLGRPIEGIAAEDVCVRFNGGTAAQGFTGEYADSVIANSRWNFDPLCPDVRCLAADAPTDGTGTTYITFIGADPAHPGVGLRDANRKWGHYDSELPVYALGVQITGRMTSLSPDPYTLRIKNLDWTGGLAAVANRGEAVTIEDLNGVAHTIGVQGPLAYWKDFDGSGFVGSADLNLITTHLNHKCTFPLNP